MARLYVLFIFCLLGPWTRLVGAEETKAVATSPENFMKLIADSLLTPSAQAPYQEMIKNINKI